MAPRRVPVLRAVICALATAASCRNTPYPQYRPGRHIPRFDGTNYHGWATYYGVPPMPGYERVHCDLPNVGVNGYGGAIAKTVAINRDQWGGSAACGMCIEVEGTGKMCDKGIQTGDCGMGEAYLAPKNKFLAVVTDEKMEGLFGDIDIGEPGWGYYRVTWRPVPCPWNDHLNAKIVLHPGASNHYLKIQLRFANTAISKAFMAVRGKRWEQAHWRFHDNYFVFQRHGGGGWEWDTNGQLEFKFFSLFGTAYSGKIDRKLMVEPYEYTANRF